MPVSLARRGLLAVASLSLVTAAFAATPPARTFSVMRYEEDWSWLATAADLTPDPFDAVKYRRWENDWHLTFGGSTRLRAEADENRTLGASPVEDDTLLRFRTFLHLEVAHAKDFRWFAEVRYSDTWDTDRTVSPLYRDDPDFQNFFLEGTFGSKTPHPVTLRVGRQELLFGLHRLVGPLDWVNTRRTFDGVSLVAKTKRTRTQVFATHPVDHEVLDIDSPIEDVLFAGVDTVFKPRDGHLVEGYLYQKNDRRDRFASEDTDAMGDLERTTVGVRYQLDAKDGWVAETEWSLQAGTMSDDDISALAISATGGYQWKEAKWKPRLTAGLDWASGDSDPDDGERETFDQLFPTGHMHLGHLDLVGRQNVQAARLQLEVWPIKGLKWETALHSFRLDENRDALYDAGAAVVRKDPTGESPRDVATELDLLLSYTWKTHHAVTFEVTHWWSDDFVDQTGSGKDATFAWVGYELKF